MKSMEFIYCRCVCAFFVLNMDQSTRVWDWLCTSTNSAMGYSRLSLRTLSLLNHFTCSRSIIEIGWHNAYSFLAYQVCFLIWDEAKVNLFALIAGEHLWKQPMYFEDLSHMISNDTNWSVFHHQNLFPTIRLSFAHSILFTIEIYFFPFYPLVSSLSQISVHVLHRDLISQIIITNLSSTFFEEKP